MKSSLPFSIGNSRFSTKIVANRWLIAIRHDTASVGQGQYGQHYTLRVRSREDTEGRWNFRSARCTRAASRRRSFIHGGKDQHKSCTAHHGEPLLCPCLRTACNFFGYFSGLGNVASPSSNEQGLIVSSCSGHRCCFYSLFVSWSWQLLSWQQESVEKNYKNRIKLWLILLQMLANLYAVDDSKRMAFFAFWPRYGKHMNNANTRCFLSFSDCFCFRFFAGKNYFSVLNAAALWNQHSIVRR